MIPVSNFMDLKKNKAICVNIVKEITSWVSQALSKQKFLLNLNVVPC